MAVLESEELKKGEEYKEAKSTIVINLLNFEFYKRNSYHNIAHMKFEKKNPEAKTKLEQWLWELYMSRHRAILDYNSGMSEAKRQGIEDGLKEGIKQGIEQGIEEGIEEGRKKGIEQGLKEGAKIEKIEIARNMLKEKINIQIIEKVTGLTKEEIEKK